MQLIKAIPFFVLVLLLTNACAPQLSPFTQKLYDENNWSESELKKIQFYLSEDVVLRRNLRSGSSEIVEGEIKMVDGRKVEEILIRKNTPGILLFSPKEKRLAVSFESGKNDRFLMFGPNPKVRNHYVLLASDWDKRKGKITYDDKEYYTSGQNAFAGLLVDLKRTRKVKVKSRTLGGREL